MSKEQIPRIIFWRQRYLLTLFKTIAQFRSDHEDAHDHSQRHDIVRFVVGKEKNKD